MLGVEPDYLLYLEVSPHWTLVHNVEAMLPVIFALQGGPRGALQSLGAPPGRALREVPLKLKIDVKLPCKML